MNGERLLKTKEAAAMLGLTDAAVRRWILLRKIPYVKMQSQVRIKLSDVERLIDASTIPAREAQK